MFVIKNMETGRYYNQHDSDARTWGFEIDDATPYFHEAAAMHEMDRNKIYFPPNTIYQLIKIITT